VAAVGKMTARACEDMLGIRPDLVPDRATTDALGDELAKHNLIRGQRFLILRADIARPVLVERLKNDGAAEVRDLPVYEIRPTTSLPPALVDALDAKRVDWITFTSSSTATNFTALVGEGYREKLAGVKIASIGPITTATLRELRLEPTVQAETFTVDGLINSICGTGF
jgi:uroporphyrinogen III methyltransferase/synthase